MSGEGKAMNALLHHDAPDTLAQASRRSKSGRVGRNDCWRYGTLCWGAAGGGCVRSTVSAGRI